MIHFCSSIGLFIVCRMNQSVIVTNDMKGWYDAGQQLNLCIHIRVINRIRIHVVVNVVNISIAECSGGRGRAG